jgi:hypothetical protein
VETAFDENGSLDGIIFEILNKIKGKGIKPDYKRITPERMHTNGREAKRKKDRQKKKKKKKKKT